MHVLLVADGRSPITKSWIQSLNELNYKVSLISTYPCQPVWGTENTYVLPVALAKYSGSQVGTLKTTPSSPSRKSRLIASFRPLFLWLRYRVGPLTIKMFKKKYLTLLDEIQPDLVHALRIPFEGILASLTPLEVPFVVSIWGNDLTLHSFGSRAMQKATLQTLERADGLLADAQRDIRLGRQWGFDFDKPNLVVPGSGGLNFVELNRSLPEEDKFFDYSQLGDRPLIINPRGFRPGSVRNDIFFKAIPHILQRLPDAFFVCTAMAGQPEALRWVHRLKIEKNVRLLPYVTQPQLWDLFKKATVSVSISEHDGTPNSLLEAMACGCFPVVGDIESLREWITPGVNGLLVDTDSPQYLADAILLAVKNEQLRNEAREINRKLILERADVSYVQTRIKMFYQQFEKEEKTLE